MMAAAAATLLRLLLVLSFLIILIQARILKLHSSDDNNNLVSDGVDHTHHLQNQLLPDDKAAAIIIAPPIILIKASCDHQYGFLPCSENEGGYIFEILVYQGLLIFGEKQINSGSKTLFEILGVGHLGGIVFRILMSLPSMILMIVSGVSSTKDGAQSQVSLGVGIFAGTTVFTLTLQWGMCVILGQTKLLMSSKPPGDEANERRRRLLQQRCFPGRLADLKDTGVNIDGETVKIARIVLLSLVPYIVVQLVDVFNPWSLFGSRIMTLIALIVSCISLLSYFIYQIRNPWVQQRSLDYAKYEMLRKGFMNHILQEGILEENGKLNAHHLMKLFNKMDDDKDQFISERELGTLVVEILEKQSVNVEERSALNDLMKKFDKDGDGVIDSGEFVQGCTGMFHETTGESCTSSSFSPSKNISRLLKVLKRKKKIDPKKIDQIMSEFLKHAQTQLPKSQQLIAQDRKPNVDSIKTLFKKCDVDNDQKISLAELKKLFLDKDQNIWLSELKKLCNIKYWKMRVNFQEIIKELFPKFGNNGDEVIEEEEFIKSISKWLDKAVGAAAKTTDTSKVIDEFYEIMWKKRVLRKRALTVSLFQLILGILVLNYMGDPLTTSIQELSNSMNLPSFCISFIVVPVAMNARSAIQAIMPASKKDERTASMAFSEIYGTVIMNNISGLATLLAIVYAKDLTWNFSAEVFTILFSCAVIGILGCSKSKTYPLWTSVVAFALYPFSLTLYYFFPVFLSWI